MSTLWTPPVTEALRELWDAGASDGLIAEALTEKFGVTFTRNAVIGYRHRHDLKRDTSAPMQKRRSPRRPAPPPRPLPTPPPLPISTAIEQPAKTEPPKNGVPYMQLREHHCRAFTGEVDQDGLPLSCGRQISAGSYCGRHALMYYTKPEPRKR